MLTHPKVTLPLSGRLEKGEGEEHKCASHCSVFTPNSVVKSKNVHHLFYIKGWQVWIWQQQQQQLLLCSIWSSPSLWASWSEGKAWSCWRRRCSRRHRSSRPGLRSAENRAETNISLLTLKSHNMKLLLKMQSSVLLLYQAAKRLVAARVWRCMSACDCCTCAINRHTLHVDLQHASLVMCCLFTAGGQQTHTQTEQAVYLLCHTLYIHHCCLKRRHKSPHSYLSRSTDSALLQ